MDGTILGQGTFVSAGKSVTIAIPSNCDFLNIYNYTQAAASASTNGVQYYWQLGMGQNGIVYSNGTANALTVGVTSGGFNLLQWGYANYGALNNGSTGISAITTSATPPVATVGSTAGMGPGYVVRLTNMSTAATYGYGSVDWTVGLNTLTGTTFSIDYMNSLAATATGNFRVIGFPVQEANTIGSAGNIVTTDGYFYPRSRYIANISAASSAVITLTVQHSYQIGQEIRLNLAGGSSVWGSYAALDNYGTAMPASSTTSNSWTITAVNYSTNTITINANTTGFGTFAYPSATVPFSAPQVVPFGEDTAYTLSINPALTSLADATHNAAYLGMTLVGGTGASAPAGQSSDVIYWVAGKSMYGGQ